jgi:hypothetical protein
MNEIRLLEIRYLGRVKNRPDGSQTAFGFCSNKWSVAITKAALYAYFGLSDRPGEANTLYNVLGVATTTTDEEIKSAWRRLIKQWHPDRCRESDARTQFDAIQHAYTVLSTKRAKYDAGLALQASLKKTVEATDILNQEYGYRAPLRCGWILGEGCNKVGKFTIEKILQWADIVNAQGQTLIAYWVMGEDKPQETWI